MNNYLQLIRQARYLRYEGCSYPAKKQSVAPYTEAFIGCNNPNMVWRADYKGQFKTREIESFATHQRLQITIAGICYIAED